MAAASPSTEEEPLLSNVRPTSSRKHNSTIIPQAHSPKVIIFLLFCIIFVLAFGGGLMAVPGLRIYEDIICHQYYDNLKGSGRIGLLEGIDENLCKIDAVQNRMNLLLAVLHFLGAIPSLVTTIPYGLLADRVGRKIVFMLSMIGMIIAAIWNFTVMRFWTVLPLRLIWLSPVFILIGGGEAVASMMFFSVGRDVTTEANRANVFLFGGSAALFATLFAPSLASTLMLRSPWIPLLLGLGLLMFGTCLIIFIPETLHLRLSSSEELTTDSSSDRSASSNKLDSPSFFVTLKMQFMDGFKKLYDSTSVVRSLPVLLLLSTFITIPFDRQSVDLSTRYISNRFSWKLREAGYLISLRAFINIILLLAILPGISYYLTERRHFSSKAKDLLLARVSAVVLLIGALLIAASPTIGLTIFGLIIWTLGTGFGALTRALITTLVDKEHVGRLYAIIALVECSSALAAGPTIAALYSLGLKLKGPWVGLPFFCLAVITLVSGMGVWCFGLLTNQQNIEEMPYGDEERETVVGNTVLLEPNSFESGTINVV